MTNNERVENYLADIQAGSADHYRILLAIRKLFTDGGNAPVESVKYGGLVYLVDEQLVGGIFVYKAHLSIEFSHGAQFEDPHGMLEGGGKHRRHLKITDLSDLESKHAGFYITQALGA